MSGFGSIPSDAVYSYLDTKTIASHATATKAILTPIPASQGQVLTADEFGRPTWQTPQGASEVHTSNVTISTSLGQSTSSSILIRNGNVVYLKARLYSPTDDMGGLLNGTIPEGFRPMEPVTNVIIDVYTRNPSIDFTTLNGLISASGVFITFTPLSPSNRLITIEASYVASPL